MATSSDKLFWATGIDNTGLSSDRDKAVTIFKQLSKDVISELNKIDTAYDKLKEKSNFKFSNPVDKGMFESMRKQVADLGTVVDTEIKKLANLSYQYDKAMTKISESSSKIKNVQAGNPLESTVTNIHRSVQKADNDISYLQRVFKRGVAYLAVYGSISWTKNFIKDIITTKGQFDQLGVAINAFVNNTDKAKRLLDQVSSFAVKSPFQLLDITNSTKQLLSYGVTAKNVMSTLQMLSDIAAGSGQRIEDLTYLYGTSMTRGRVYARELYQFATRGIPIYQALSKELGVSNEQLLKMVKNGQVGFPQLEKALQGMSAAGGRYYGLSDKIALTTYGKLSNLEDRWKVALSQIGAMNEGIINSGISATSTLIDNWKKVGDTIEGIIAVAGTYKAAQIAVKVASTGSEAAYAQKYTSTAINAVSPEWRQAAAKEGLVQGSIEYQRALEKELQLQLRNSTVAVASINAEIKANQELLVEKEILISDAEKNVIAKTTEAEAAIATGDALQIETTQSELNAAMKEKSTLETDKNTISESLNKATIELSTAEAKKNATAEVINTATTEANTAAKESGAVATALLGKAWKSLTAFIKANEFVLIAAAIAGVVFVLYKLYESINKVKTGEENWSSIQKKIDDDMQNQIKHGTDLINTMKQESSTIDAKSKAYQTLKKEYPGLIGNMKLEQALSKSGLYWTEKLTEAEEKRAKLKTINAAKEANANVKTTKAQLDSAISQQKATSSSSTLSLGTNIISYIDVKTARNNYNLAVSTAKVANKALNDLKESEREAKQAVANVVKNKDYWTKQVAAFQEKRFELPSSEKGSPEWNKLLKEEENAQKQLDKYQTGKKEIKEGETAAKRAERLRQQREQFLSEVNSRKQQISSNNQEIMDYEAQAEQMREEAYTDSMEKGYFHDKQVIENEYKKKLDDINKEQEKILKLTQQNEKNEFLNRPEKSRGVFTPKIRTWEDVPSSSKKGINDALDAANEIRKAKEESLNTELLRQYDDYTLKKEEIDRKYSEDRKALLYLRQSQPEGSIEYGAISSRLAQNEKERVSAQAELSFKQAKESPVYQLAFEDKTKVAREGLWKLIDMLNEYKDIAVQAYDPQGVKTYTEEIDKALQQLVKDDPIQVLRRGRIELKKANEELLSSEKKLAEAQLEYKNASAAVSTQPVITTDTNLEVVNKGGLPSASVSNKINSTPTNQLAAATLKLTNAEDANAIAKSKVTKITITQAEAEKTLRDSVGDLSKAVSQVGDAMGGMTGQVISLMGEISTTVIGTINSFQDVSKMAAGAMKTIETASIILAAISAAIQIIQKVISLFSSKSWAEKEYERLTQLNKVLSDTVSLYKSLLNTASGSDAQKIGEKYINSIKQEIQNAYTQAKDVTGSGASFWKSSVGHNENEAISNLYGNTWQRISKDLGTTVSSADDLYNLSASQLELLKIDFPEVWAVLDDKVQDSFNTIIDETLKLRDAENEVNDAITGISWDTLKDGMDDFLLSSTTTMSEISDSFENDMRKSILNIVKTKYLNTAMEQWYDEFSTAVGGDNKITLDEQQKLKQEYIDIYNNAESKVKDLLQIADIGLDNSNSANTVKSSFQSMSEDQADVLSAQFVAIRLNVSDILSISKDHINKFDLLATDISIIKGYTASLEEIKNTINSIRDQGLKVK